MEIDVRLVTTAINIPESDLPSREIGAVVEFQGLVREMENGRALAGLHYEAYDRMANKVLRGHFEELAERYDCAAVCLIHRLGWVPVGEASLYIRVLSSHRAEAFKFLSEAIDRLKLDVPIWKRAKPPETAEV